jgi:predicted transcriptional regulator
MANRKDASSSRKVRTSILVDAETDRRLREMAKRHVRPLSWEIRQALERHVQENYSEEPVAA